MGCCGYCPTPGMTDNEFQFLRGLVPDPRVQPSTPIPGVTYYPQPVDSISPYRPDLGTSWKWHEPDLFFWASLLRASYAPDNSFVDRVGNDFKDVEIVAYQAPGPGFTYGWNLLRYSDGAVLNIAGTANRYQAISYFVGHLGDVYTAPSGWQINAAWEAGAAPIRAALGSLLQPNEEVLVLGHSSGAAVGAAVIAGLLSAGSTNKFGQVTFGAPAYATPTLKTQLAAASLLRITTPDDPVPYLPPPSWVGYAARAALPIFRAPSATYTHQQGALSISQGQSVTTVQSNDQSNPAWLQRAAAFLINLPGNLDAHQMASYSAIAQTIRPASAARTLQFWANYPDLDAAAFDMDQAGL